MVLAIPMTVWSGRHWGRGDQDWQSTWTWPEHDGYPQEEGLWVWTDGEGWGWDWDGSQQFPPGKPAHWTTPEQETYQDVHTMDTKQQGSYQMVDEGRTAVPGSAVPLREAQPKVTLIPATYLPDGQPTGSGRNVRVKLATGHYAVVPGASLRHEDGLRENEIKTGLDMIVEEDVDNGALRWTARHEDASKNYRLQTPAATGRVMGYYVLDQKPGGNMTITPTPN